MSEQKTQLITQTNLYQFPNHHLKLAWITPQKKEWRLKMITVRLPEEEFVLIQHFFHPSTTDHSILSLQSNTANSLYINIYFPSVLSSSRPTDTSSCISCSHATMPSIYYGTAIIHPMTSSTIEIKDLVLARPGFGGGLNGSNSRNRTLNQLLTRNSIFSSCECSSMTASRKCCEWDASYWWVL